MKPKSRIPTLVRLLFTCVLLQSARVSAVEDPPNCSLSNGGLGNTSQGGINFNLPQAHVGDTVPVFPSLGMAGAIPPNTPYACRAISATGVVYLATGPLTNFLVNVDLDPGTLVSCPGDPQMRCQPGPYNVLITPALVGAPVNSPNGGAPGVAKTVRAVENGFGTVKSITDEQLSDFHSASIAIVTPCIKVFKTCDLLPGQTCFTAETPVRFRGYVTNCGDITLTNVTVIDNRAGQMQLYNPANGALLPVPVILPVGAYAVFSNSFLPTLQETCSGTATNVITATAKDTTIIGGPNASVTNSFTDICPICYVPGITITKQCPPGLIEPGTVLKYTGVVSNAGNITLTNVIIVNNQPAPNTPVLGPITLVPGAFLPFTNSYTVPLDSCGPYVDTLTVRANTTCGAPLTNTATAICPYTNSPRITITKNCPAVPVAPSQLSTITGVVSNAGNITLTNVFVYDDQPDANTLLLGPITLAPGQIALFTNSHVLPPNCCTYVDTVHTTGQDKCFGRTVADSATAVCMTVTDPRLTITKICPLLPVPLGQPLVFSGIVSNAGNITITNVTVVNDQPAPNTPVLGPLNLAPGERASFTGSYLVPANICATNILDTVTARGNNICNGANVTASQSALCPIQPTPRLVVTKNCPANPVPPHGVLNFSGMVSNAGNITLTNVIVVNDQPTNNTLVLGPVTLVPNQFINFNGSYQTCPECCPPYVDTITATGAQICNGSNVTATATAYCPGISKPNLNLIVDCPPAPALLGQLLFYSGSVSNSGDVTVGSVLITDNKSGFVAQIPALAPAETADFFGFYQATNCGPNIATLVTATAFDVCTGAGVSNQLSSACAIICPPNQGPVLINPTVSGGQFKFSFATQLGLTYTVQYTDSLLPANWQTLTSFIGDGSIAMITDPTANQGRFYRVLVQ